MAIKGFASVKDTEIYSKKYKGYNYNVLGKTGLLVSDIGFGCRKIDIRSPLNRDALKKAMLVGINILDTNANFTNGNSELLIGDVLEEIINADLLNRDSLVIITKGGCLQGENYEMSLERKQDGIPYPDLIEIKEGFEYCIHPECLEEQITLSLARLNVETIDVYLLDDPEYYLKWAENKKIDKESARQNYYKKIKKAFEYLEKEIQRGRIKHYGISSNTFSCNEDEYAFTSLEKIIEIANEISKDNHFSVIECPINLMEKKPAVNKNLLTGLTLPELAKKENLGVLINRPICAISGDKIIKLAEPIIHNAPNEETINNELESIKNIEQIICDKLKVTDNKEIETVIKEYLFVFDKLKNSWQKYNDIFEWNEKINMYFLPRFHYYKNFIKTCLLKDENLEMDLYGCTFKVGKIFSSINIYYENEYLKFAQELKEKLIESTPELANSNKLSSMALHALRSTKGVTSVLTGIGLLPYVIDALVEMKKPINIDFDWNKINI